MKRLILSPKGWPCMLFECPPGFFMFHDSLCFKSEYGGDEVFCDSGEIFWGGVSDKQERGHLVVQPVVAEWENYEA